MTTDTIQLLAKYNSHVNGEMNKVISQLDQEAWEKDLGGHYKSVRSICTHIYIADINWLKRFGLLKPFHFLKNPLFQTQYNWESIPFITIEEYMSKRDELDVFIKEFADEVQDADLGKNLRYKSMKGEDQDRNFGGVLLHVFNHQTHHRGMISLYLELLGKANDYSNLIVLA